MPASKARAQAAEARSHVLVAALLDAAVEQHKDLPGGGGGRSRTFGWQSRTARQPGPMAAQRLAL
jgi:hypothetical protein